MKIPVAAIVGPTATGKSEVGIEVAGIIGGEIVSVDSMQVYRGMDIGTAKVMPDEQYTKGGRPIPHHMLDIVDADNTYSVGRYQEEARRVIKDIFQRRRLPILVGGTGLYYNALVYEYEFMLEGHNDQLRSELWGYAEKKGSLYLHDKLKAVDPNAALAIHHNDAKRIIRALEVYYLTGRPISESAKNRKQTYDLAAVGLYMEREALYARVDQRVDIMLEKGLVEEVRRMLSQGIKPEGISMQALGYKEIAGYLLGYYDYDECVRTLKRNTRRFAKRQMTWFKRDKNIKWFNVQEYRSKDHLVEITACYFQSSLQIQGK